MVEEMSFSVKDVLKRPLFNRAQLIAGEQGLYREVRWVHILEITHAAPYVSKNDLILTTGLWLKKSVRSGLEYMQQIVDHETAGLCIEFGTTIDEIPERIIAFCNDHDFPLILFRQPVRFEEITQDIHSYLINRHFGLMKNLEKFSQQQQQLILQSTDIPAILRLLQRYSGRQIVYVSSIKPNTFYPEVDQKQAEQISHFCSEKLSRSDKMQETKIWKMDAGHFILVQPVICFGQVFSFVGILFHQPNPSEYMTLLVDYTVKAVATVLLRTQFLEEKIMRSQNELVQDILSRRIDSEEQAQTRMGLPSPDEERYLFIGGIIEFEHNVIEAGPERMETMNQDISVLIRSLLNRYQTHHLMMMKNNQIYLLCAKEKVNKEAAVLLENGIRDLIDGLRKFVDQAFDGLDFYAGFGKMRNLLLETWKSFSEARHVIDVSRRIPSIKKHLFYENIGIYQFLKAVPQTFLHGFVSDHLGSLIDYDQTHHLNLVKTLAVYFQCMGSKGKTANRLFIHRQTLYHRLEKISDLLGEDFFKPQKRYCLEIALLAYEMLGKPEKSNM